VLDVNLADMTIRELIEKLKQYKDGELQVVIDTCEGSYISLCAEYFNKKDNKLVILI